MGTISYRGKSNVRRVSVADLAGHGLVISEDLVWDKANDYTLDNVDDTVIAFLLANDPGSFQDSQGRTYGGVASLPGMGAVADGVDSLAYAELPDLNTSGFVVKVAPGTPTYGRGQAFMVLEEGPGDATDQSGTGSVIFRVNEKGSIGMTGGMHVATGFRKAYGGTQAVWIDPAENVIGLLVHNPSAAESPTWTSDFIRVVDVRNADELLFRVLSNGVVMGARNIISFSGDSKQVVAGSVGNKAGIGLGVAVDTILNREAAGIIGFTSVLEGTEVAAPAAPAVNKGRLFYQDNGSGKTQLAVRFNTGAVQVIATEP